MGNWKTVQIQGKCDFEDVQALRTAIDCVSSYENLECLSHTAGMAGLPNWASEHIDAIGNLAERGYTVDSVARELERLGKIAPSLAVSVHVGKDYESNEVEATVVLKDGKAEIREPAVDQLGEIPPGQAYANLMKQMMSQRR